MRCFDLPGRSRVIAENGMAATSHPLATVVALDVLKDGGNAVDAAVAASAVLAVVEPQMTGIGGDCFAIVAEPDGSVHGLNGSGRVASAADAAALRAMGHDKVPATGGLSVTVPGALDAWERLAARFGTRGLDALLQPAIHYAEAGFAIHERVAWDWAIVADGLARDEGTARHCLRDGRAPVTGERFAFPALGRTLRAIAAGGSRAFYEGAIAREIAATVRKAGGFMEEEDLAAVRSDWVTPISTRYGGHDVLEIPPNGQGIVALVILNILDALGAGKLPPDSAERHHVQIEAGRLAYSVRDHLLADPASMTSSVAQILSAAHARALAARIDPDRRADAIVLPDLPDADTIYLTVVDRDRRAVSFINSIYSSFGAQVATPESGVVLQNRGSCFSLAEGHPNEMKGGKRPMHTIIPAMAMKDGRAAFSFGVMGGAYQPMGHAHVFSNLVDHGMDVQAAIDHARVFWGEGGALLHERHLPADVIGELEARGHVLKPTPKAWGGSQIIRINHETGFLEGGSDARKDGMAAGW